MERLCKEVKLDYQRSMNKITFEKVVSRKPERFSFVTVEEKVPEIIPEAGLYHQIIFTSIK